MEGKDLTAYRHLQAHAAFTFGAEVGGDVP
jgi:hypothetical protein